MKWTKVSLVNWDNGDCMERDYEIWEGEAERMALEMLLLTGPQDTKCKFQ